MSQIRSTPSRMPCRALCGAVFCALAGALLPGATHAQTPPFVDINDGTVTHTITSPSGAETLTWQQCQIGQSDAGCADDGSGSDHNWYNAWAAAFAANREGDVNGWRMPSQHELYRLYFDGAGQQAGQPFSVTEFPNTSGFVWSGSPRASLPLNAWGVSFYHGGAYYDYRYDYQGVRLVRAGQCFGALAPLARPATPTVTVMSGGNDLEFSWTMPAGGAGQAVLWSGSGISDYSAEAARGLGGSCTDNLTTAAIEAYAYSTNGGASWTVKDVTDASATSATISGYDPADFDFRLTAINTGGLWSEMLRVNQNGTFHNTSTFEGPTATGTGIARAEIVDFDNTSCRFDINKTKLINATGTPQANVYFPHGLLDFTLINCSTPNEIAEIKITWPSSLAGGTYWKDLGASWVEFTTTGCTDDGCAAINGNEVTIYVQDGGAFDLDGVADGSIRDPSGIALLKVGTGGTPIPALPAPLIALTGLLAALAGWRLHRARAGSPQA